MADINHPKARISTEKQSNFEAKQLAKNQSRWQQEEEDYEFSQLFWCSDSSYKKKQTVINTTFNKLKTHKKIRQTKPAEDGGECKPPAKMERENLDEQEKNKKQLNKYKFSVKIPFTIMRR